MVNYIPSNGDKLTFNGDGWAINPTVIPGQGFFDNSFFTATWRDILIGLTGTGTLEVYGSIQQAPVDFTQPSGVGNMYALVVLSDYTTPNTYTAGTVSVSNSTKIVELNTNLLTWVGIKRSIDTVDAILTITNAQ